MYDRQVDDRTLTIHSAGMLWNKSVVMMDVETKSLWSHVLGEAMDGPLQGKKLTIIPSLMTDWKTWRTIHPETTVALLDRTTRDYKRTFYRDRDLSQFVVALRNETQSKAWGFDQLSRHRVVNDQFAGNPLVLVFDRQSITVFAFRRRADDRVLTFKRDGEKLIDDQTGSLWHAATGTAIQGPLKGQQLKPLPAIISFRRAWLKFYPDTIVWQGLPDP